MKVVWTAEAIERLKEIDAYISHDSPALAAKLVDRLLERGDSLAEFPRSGRKVPEHNLADYRELIEGNYRIVYRVKADVVEIETVFEGHRLLPEKP